MSELERAIDHIYNMMPDDDREADFLSIAIKAMNEKLEREKGCEHCDFEIGDVGTTMNDGGDKFVLVKSGGSVALCTDERFFYTLKINFCPMCGKQLKGCGEHE